MLKVRIRIALIIILVGVGFVIAGGWLFRLFVLGMLSVAGWEFWRLFRQGNYSPSLPIIVLGIVSVLLGLTIFGSSSSTIVLSLVVMAAMVYHLFSYQRGAEYSAIDFCITLGGVVYLGIMGSHLVLLREIKDGLWWLLLVVPAVGIADSGAYFIGVRYGRHKMATRISPKKSWEGYLGGIVTGTLGSVLLAMLSQSYAPTITTMKGLIIGLTVSIIAPLGDLGESMLKRQFGVKDSSQILPGHGGILDRIDSWLWSAVIGYYLIIWFFH